MSLLARFRQGMQAAVPIWIVFVPSSIAWGIAAQRHGLSFNEAIFMSAWVYSGPAQFAVLAPLAENKSAMQVLIAGFLMNLRFLPMSTALTPFFRGVKRMPLLVSSHVISASSFIVPYVQFQKERASAEYASSATSPENGYRNLMFFLGVGITSFLVWITGTGTGFGIALRFPHRFDEALLFILPGYFAGLLVVETKGLPMMLVCLGSLIAALPGAVISSGWGWLATAIGVATLVWGVEQWKIHASRSF
jgi:branched chain amino acid efflux pump